MRFFVSSSVSEGYWKKIFNPMRHHTADIEAMGLWEGNIPAYAAPYAALYCYMLKNSNHMRHHMRHYTAIC
jgi:hypothetical protein